MSPPPNLSSSNPTTSLTTSKRNIRNNKRNNKQKSNKPSFIYNIKTQVLRFFK